MEKTQRKLHTLRMEINTKRQPHHKTTINIKCPKITVSQKVRGRKNEENEKTKANLGNQRKMEEKGKTW